MKEPVFAFGQSTNKFDFFKFLESIKLQRVNQENKPWIVLDNHKAHHSLICKEILSDNFRTLFLPAYSCRFNSIESLWALMKKLFPSYVCDHVYEATTFEFTEGLVKSMIGNLQTSQIQIF